MLSFLWTSIITKPLYNGLIILMHLLPFADAGIVIIVFTIIIKLILFPLSIKASKAQIEMKSIENDLNLIKETYKDNKEEQSRKTLELYREKGINPFSGFFILIIQLPIIIGLYRIFLSSGLPKVNMTLLYSFVPSIMTVNMMFLGLINLASKSIPLAILAGITTYFQLDLANKNQNKTMPKAGGAQADIALAMSRQMKYFFPVLVIFISYSISAAVALYWVTSNLFAIGQEIYIRKKYHQAVSVI